MNGTYKPLTKEEQEVISEEEPIEEWEPPFMWLVGLVTVVGLGLGAVFLIAYLFFRTFM